MQRGIEKLEWQCRMYVVDHSCSIFDLDPCNQERCSLCWQRQNEKKIKLCSHSLVSFSFHNPEGLDTFDTLKDCMWGVTRLKYVWRKVNSN